MRFSIVYSADRLAMYSPNTHRPDREISAIDVIVACTVCCRSHTTPSPVTTRFPWQRRCRLTVQSLNGFRSRLKHSGLTKTQAMIPSHTFMPSNVADWVGIFYAASIDCLTKCTASRQMTKLASVGRSHHHEYDDVTKYGATHLS